MSNLIGQFTGYFWYTFEGATQYANELTKSKKEYFTAIKGKSYWADDPNARWAVTNRFDPRVIKVEDKE